MLETISYNDLKKRITGEDNKKLSVKSSGILNYLFATRMVVSSGKGVCRITSDALGMLDTMTKNPEVGDIVAVINTGIYLLVGFSDKDETAICARIEMSPEFVYKIPPFTVTEEPNDLKSSFNKFPVGNMFVLRKGSFDMTEVLQLYDKFKVIWNTIRKLRIESNVHEKEIVNG